MDCGQRPFDNFYHHEELNAPFCNGELRIKIVLFHRVGRARTSD